MGIIIKNFCVFLLGLLLIITGCGASSKEQPISSEDSAVTVSETPAVTEAVPTAESSEAPAKQIYTEYTIALDVDPTERTVSGVEKIKYTNTSSDVLNELYVNLYFNAFNMESDFRPYFKEHEKKIFPSGVAYGSINVTQAVIEESAVEYEIEGTVMKVNLPRGLQPGAAIDLSLVFTAYVPPISERTGANAAAVWFGNFLPTAAVYDKSGWHIDKYYPAGDPFFSDMSIYNLTFTTPEGVEVVSTGVENVTENDGKTVTTVNTKPVRDFAFAVSASYNRATVTSADTGTEINFYYYSNVEKAEEYLKTAKAALEFYSHYIGAYPYATLDLIETELFITGGMEYPQVVFLDSALLQDEASATKSIVHEVVHQWFYSLIGNDQINSPWIDEGLTAFFQDYYLYQDEEFDKAMLSSYNSLVKKLPAFTAYRLEHNLSAYNSWSEYYNIAYVRGKLLFYALYRELGPPDFAAFIKTCYKNYSLKIIYPEDIIKTAEETCGRDLTDFFDAWMNDKTLPELP